MKHIIGILFLCFPIFIWSQPKDSSSVERSIDRLILISQFKKFDGAIKTLEKAKRKAVDEFGKTSAPYAKCLHAEAALFIRLGKFKEAEPYCREAKEIRGQVLNREDPDYSLSVSYLATLYRELGRYEEAEPLALEALEIRAKVPGKVSREYAVSLQLLGVIYLKTSRYEKAEAFLLESKNIFANTEGRESAYYSICISNLAALYGDWGRYDKVEKLYLEAKTLQEIRPGKNSTAYAATMNNLAWFYFQNGQYNKALNYFTEARQIFANIYGKKHESYASVLGNLSSFYLQTGQYGKSELFFQETLKVLEKASGKETLTYASVLSNLGALYEAVGRDTDAVSVLLSARNILQKLNDSSAVYISYLTNLGGLYYYTERYNDAEPLFIQAKNRRKEMSGDTTLDYASCLNNLAQLYSACGKYESAEEMLLKAQSIYLKTVGNTHPTYGTSLRELALLYQKEGKILEAEQLFKNAREIFIKTLGINHPSYLNDLADLADLYWSTSRISEAMYLYLEFNVGNRRLIEKSADYFSEKELLDYIQDSETDLARFYSFAYIHPVENMICQSFDNVLFYKGYLLENVRFLETAVANADSLSRDTFERWQGAKRLLAREYAQPVDERKHVAELEALSEGFEKTLIRRLPFLGAVRKIPSWKDVGSRLKKKEAAIEFIRFRLYKPYKTDSVIYAAFVLLNGDTCPHFIPLGEQRVFDNLAQIKYPDKRYERAKNKDSFYNLIWKPIEPFLVGIDKIYYAPDGILHQLNLDAISVNAQGDSTLVDRYELVRLGSTRQLAFPFQAKVTHNNAFVFGGINYDLNKKSISRQIRKKGITQPDNILEGSPVLINNLSKSKTLAPLPNSLSEAILIGQLMEQKGIQTSVFTGFSASEEAFKHFSDSLWDSRNSARIIHISTHGFFFPSINSNNYYDQRAFSEPPFFKNSVHPFLRSGLVFAGGNYAWQTGHSFEKGMEDGILTAYEISAMSFPNTELVVLSACETGLGDLNDNEGIYGLQRAFKIAGAQYLIMSLWGVPDEATKDLMTTFYRNWLETKMDIPTAFRSAQLAMKKKYIDPEKWAGFILVQ